MKATSIAVLAVVSWIIADLILDYIKFKIFTKINAPSSRSATKSRTTKLRRKK